MYIRRNIFLSVGILIAAIYILFLLERADTAQLPGKVSVETRIPFVVPTQVEPSITKTPELPALPNSAILENDYHVYQTFNNCGPAALSMALSYFDMKVTQKELGDALRPFQNQQGDNDDKSVTLEELAEKSKEYGLQPFHRPAGDVTQVKHFVAQGMPVIVRTLLNEGEDIGHYRVIKGYDDATGEFVQDDSLQGKNLRYAYDSMVTLWRPYNFEYLVLARPEKVQIVEQILGPDRDVQIAWEKAERRARERLVLEAGDVYAGLNVSVALYHLGRYEESVLAFEKVEARLPFRALWYQIEPIQAYAKLEQYDRVLSITSAILQNHNRAFSELYIIRGRIYQLRGDTEAANREFDLARLYNVHIDVDRFE